MYLVHSCPCCGSQKLTESPAILSPFIADYAIQTQPFLTALLECSSCTFRFFKHRFDSQEIKRLYENYRGEVYFQKRHHHEPWYTRKLNDSIGNSPDEILMRTQRTEKFLEEQVDLSTLQNVLDYGGDRGQFIPKGVGIKKYVFEISDVKPLEGVKRIHQENELQAQPFHLILLSHVLEHCSEPQEFLNPIRALLKNTPNALLYIEVPYERYQLRFLWNTFGYKKYLSCLMLLRPLLTIIDFFSTAFRMQTRTIPPLGFLKLHEHLNFFNEKSLRTLLENHGFSVLHCKVVRDLNITHHEGALLCLAKISA